MLIHPPPGGDVEGAEHVAHVDQVKFVIPCPWRMEMSAIRAEEDGVKTWAHLS